MPCIEHNFAPAASGPTSLGASGRKELRQTRGNIPSTLANETNAVEGAETSGPSLVVLVAVCPPSTSLQGALLLEWQIGSCAQDSATRAQPSNRSRAKDNSTLGDPVTLPLCPSSPYRVCLALRAQKACCEVLQCSALSPRGVRAHTHTNTSAPNRAPTRPRTHTHARRARSRTHGRTHARTRARFLPSGLHGHGRTSNNHD